MLQCQHLIILLIVIQVEFTLNSNISGGTGVSTSVIVKYSAAEDKILINTVPLAQTNIRK